MKRLILIFFIALLPFIAKAHEGHGEVLLIELEKRAGVLPGEIAYSFDRMDEWVSVNLFTLSTKRKQEKKLELTGERLAEFMVMVEKFPDKTEAIHKAFKGYEKFLSEARDMAEKIIFLDGAEIVLAENVEEKSRVQEFALLDLLLESDPAMRPYINQTLSIARIENELIFKYMATNYQGTDADVEKHRDIIQKHLDSIESRFLNTNLEALSEAKKFQAAGLNIQAYDWLKKAKNVLY